MIDTVEQEKERSFLATVVFVIKTACLVFYLGATEWRRETTPTLDNWPMYAHMSQDQIDRAKYEGEASYLNIPASALTQEQYNRLRRPVRTKREAAANWWFELQYDLSSLIGVNPVLY